MATSFSAPRARSPLARWFAERTGGERRVIAALLGAAAAVALWAGIWQPLVRDLAALRATRDGDAVALAAARHMSEEIAGLARSAGAPVAADARAALERVLAQQNVRSAVTQLDWQDSRARVVFAAIDYDALMVALEALQRDALLRVAEASLTARVEPGVVRAELSLAR